jgi:hypothetical protein
MNNIESIGTEKNRDRRISMRVTPRLKLLSVCVAAAIAQMVAVPALADSGKGVDTTLGNARNNSYPIGQRDGEASSHLHTPTGQLYAMPAAEAEPGITTADGWVVDGSIEAGLLRSQASKKNAIYDMYRDNSNGFNINNFNLKGEKSDSARYFEISGGGVGKKDQFYGLTVGRYNDWKVKTFYNETPHVFTTTYRSLWDGIGTGNLTLKPGLTAGGASVPPNAGTPGTTTADANSVIAAAAAGQNTELSIVRKKGGVRLDMNVLEGTKFIASYSNEKRKGARAFGMVAGQGGGGGQGTPFLEVPESIDYTTHDFFTGIQYSDEVNSLNVNVTASVFKNNIGTETIEIPLSNAATYNALGAAPTFATATGLGATGLGANALKLGRFDLVPDNKAYNASAEYERLLPALWDGRFNATVSTGTSKQDDALIAPSANALGAVAGITTNAQGAWNTTGALSQQSAGAKIDNKLVDLGLLMKPAEGLDVKAKFRHYETKNSTRYLACNPNAQYVDTNPGANNTNPATPGGINAFGCNGVWGRILNDGAASSLFQTSNVSPGTAVNTTIQPNSAMYIQSTPYDSKQDNYALTGDYKLSKFSSVNGSFEREDVKRRFRERATTAENKIKLGYVNSGIENATLRVSIEQDNRTGSAYSTTQYRTTQMSGALYPYLPAVSPTAIVLPVAAYQSTAYYETRRIDVADRKQNILNARFNYMVTPELDAGFTGQMKRVRYPDAELGTSRRDQDSFNVDLTYQPSAEFTISGFYSYQVGKYNMASSTGAVALGAAATAINPAGFTNSTLTASGCTDLNPGGCSNPYNRLGLFRINTRDTNNVVGLDAAYDFSKALLKAAVTSSKGVTWTSYQYGTGVGSLALAQTGPKTGTGMPDMLFDQKSLDLNLLVPTTKKLTTKLMYHFETVRITDWHYTNVQGSPVASLSPAPAAGVAQPAGVPLGFVLDQGPQNYHVHAFGVMLNYKL